MAAASSSDWLDRGGKRQRLARGLQHNTGRDAGHSRVYQSPLFGDEEVDLLLELFALGLLPASTLQQICAAADRVASRPQTKLVASLGAQGRHANNVHRDLVTKLKLNQCDIAEADIIDIPMKAVRTNGAFRHQPRRALHPDPLMLPHMLLAKV